MALHPGLRKKGSPIFSSRCTGTLTKAAGKGTILTDSAATFVASGVIVGDNFTSVGGGSSINAVGGETYVTVNNANVLGTPRASGTATSVAASKLKDSGAHFDTALVAVGDLVINWTTGDGTTVTVVDSAIQLEIADDIFTEVGVYKIFAPPAYTVYYAV